MRAVVLVGGEGTRLRPLTYTVPKQMLPVAELPMIERVVGHLARHGASDVVLSLGYRPDAFMAAYPDGRCNGATLTYVVEPELLDTAGAIRFAARRAGISDTFLVVNGDVLTDFDVAALIRFHRQRGAEGTIALTPVDDPSPFGVVDCADDGRVGAFIEKPPPGTAPTNLINAGTYVLEPEVLERIPGDRRVNVERETFPVMASEGRLFALSSSSYWLDVGTPERFIQASLDLANGVRRGPPLAGAVEVAPSVWLAGSAAVDGEVVGPALIGEGAIVAPHARVSASVIGAGARVGAGAGVSGSIVLAGATIGEGAVVADSIIGWCAQVAGGASVAEYSVVGERAEVTAGAQLRGARQPA